MFVFFFAASVPENVHNFGAQEFSTYSVIRPQLHHTRHKRDISTTKLEVGQQQQRRSNDFIELLFGISISIQFVIKILSGNDVESLRKTVIL